MKLNVIVMAAFLFSATVIKAKVTEEIPLLVKKAFLKEYPHGRTPKWAVLDNGNIFSVRFVYEDRAVTAYFNSYGLKVANASQVQEEQLPSFVKKKIKKFYKEGDIIVAEKITIDEEVIYLLTVLNKSAVTTINIRENGIINWVQKKKKLVAIYTRG
jgi:hypothetical protein